MLVKTEDRRLVRVWVDPLILRRMVTEGKEFHQKCVKGLPEDAEWIGEYFDELAFRVCFIFRHDSFKPAPQGEVLPLLELAYEEKRPHDTPE